MTNQTPTITVAIPTIGRDQCLIDLLGQLLTQTRPPDEILISDQNFPPLPTLDQFLDRHPEIRRIRSELKGVVANMNLLLRDAKSDIILYLDDDVVVRPDLVESHLKNYEDSKIDAVAGAFSQPSGDLPESRIFSVGRYHALTGSITANFNSNRRQYCDIAQGLNMSMRRKKMIGAGGFDVGFVGNGYFFESEATYRLVVRGARMIFDPKTHVQHLAVSRGGARIHDKALHNFYFVRNGIRFYRRHSPLIGLPFRTLYFAVYSFLKALKNRSPRILWLALRGIVAGLFQSSRIDQTGLHP